MGVTTSLTLEREGVAQRFSFGIEADALFRHVETVFKLGLIILMISKRRHIGLPLFYHRNLRLVIFIDAYLISNTEFHFVKR